jgi:hypothetical protein
MHPPDRIPPPPPLPDHDSTCDTTQDNLNRSNDDDPSEQQTGCILRVRCPVKSGGSMMVKIQLYEEMSAELLGRCVSQAVASYSSANPETIVVSRR